MYKYSADWVFPVNADPIEKGVVILDDQGTVLALDSRDQHDSASLDIRRGVLTPGFVNAHCHLELSHMKGRMPTGSGLIPFIFGIITDRGAEQEFILDAIEKAEREMLEGGIVAVGDISNTRDTFEAKSRGRMRYYTFVELYDSLQDTRTETAFADWKAVYDQLTLAAGSRKGLTPHATYSVSEALFKKIREFNAPQGDTVSIHNQETPPENTLFLEGRGDFYDFFARTNSPIDHFKPIGKTAIHYALQHLNPDNRTLFVHNTLSTREDIAAAQAWSAHTYWASCPNANLYIENRLPDYQAFLDTNARVALGTDSLTSNWQLSILEEMKTIARYQSFVPFATLLRWATLHGAEALGFEDTLGSLEPGKSPGLLLIEDLGEGLTLRPETRVQRLK
jgi:cytosine/adenosine deaminase-related metal-dependent hydrolase